MASELYTECVTAKRGATALELANEMGQESVGTVVIVDEKRAPVGIVTDRDILCRVIAEGRDENETTADEIMSAPLVLGSESMTTQEALATTTANRIRRLPIVDEEGKIVRVLSLDEVITGLSDELFRIGSRAREFMREELQDVVDRLGRDRDG